MSPIVCFVIFPVMHLLRKIYKIWFRETQHLYTCPHFSIFLSLFYLQSREVTQYSMTLSKQQGAINIDSCHSETGKGMTWTFSKSKFHAPYLGLSFPSHTFNYLSFFSQGFLKLSSCFTFNDHRMVIASTASFHHIHTSAPNFPPCFQEVKQPLLKIFQGCSNIKCFCRCAAWDVSIAEVLCVDVFFLLLSLPIITFDDWSCPLF